MRSFILLLIGCCLGVVLGIVIDKSTDRFVEYGVVTDIMDDLASGGNGSWYEVKRITIERLDGTRTVFDNDDDLLMWKRNSRDLQEKIVNGKLYKFVINGFGNIVTVQAVTNAPSRYKR